LITSEVAENVLVELVLQAIGSTIRCQRHPIDVRLSCFDVVNFTFIFSKGR
jgi:hypothetical protein